jgi:periplasmic divalent cation tolerance protein
VENLTRACVVLTTWPPGTPAEPFARALVDEQLAACVHIAGPGTSIYRWQGAIDTAAEHTILIKTTSGRLAALEARVRTLHPYDVPEWLVIEVSGSEAYLAWLEASVAEVR